MSAGARSYEPAELHLLESLEENHFSRYDQSDWFSAAWQDALAHLANSADCFGVSLDLDAMDPTAIPAVLVPESGGIVPEDICAIKHLMEQTFLCGARDRRICPEL